MLDRIDIEFREDVVDRLARIEAHVSPLGPALDTIEGRVVKLEKWQARLGGMVTALAMGLAYMGRDRLADALAIFH